MRGAGDKSLVEFAVAKDSPIAGTRILNIGLPAAGLIVLPHRDGISGIQREYHYSSRR